MYTPGIQGRGVPTLSHILIDSVGAAFTLLKGRQFRAARNRVVTALADLWGFYIAGHFRQTSVFCPCCGWEGPAFRATSNWRAVTFQSACPVCDSRSRHRGLMKILPEVVTGKPRGPILVFAPEQVILRHLSDLTSEPIYTTDLYRSDVDFPGEDIQNLSFRDRMFALLICNHVLEHVPNDQAALHECARILKGEGVAVFTVPGDFSRNQTWYFDSPDDNGHYRHYGLDIVDKMRLAFETVQAVDMGRVTPPSWKVRAGDYVFICVKGADLEST